MLSRYVASDYRSKIQYYSNFSTYFPRLFLEVPESRGSWFSAFAKLNFQKDLRPPENSRSGYCSIASSRIQFLSTSRTLGSLRRTFSPLQNVP